MALTPKKKKFAKCYISKEFFGNGIQSYAEVYGIDLSKPGKYKSAGTCAYRLLKDVEVLAYINKLLGDMALNDPFVDKQLAFLITQHANMGCKLGAIREYNALKRRITQDVNVNFSFAQMTKVANGAA